MKFEYKTMKVDGPLADDALNKLGEDRWRLVSLVLYSEGQVRTFTYVFIREKILPAKGKK